MSNNRWKIYLGLGLLALGILLYSFHYFVFRDSHHLFIYLLGDLSFVPFEVLLVTLILHVILDKREKRRLNHSLNMVIGIFFHEVGAHLLSNMQRDIPQENQIREVLKPEIMESWSEADYAKQISEMEKHKTPFSIESANLICLRDFLQEKRSFILEMLENPHLEENTHFVKMIWAVTHVSDELVIRPNIENLQAEETAHMELDLQRAFNLLVVNWMKYILHLKRNYPYMYIAALRFGPFAQAG
jgi:hypothetical protein